MSSQESRSDARGFPGWEVVDKLAGYLVSLNRTITALSASETDDIVRLYSSLHAMDQTLTKYSLKCKRKTLAGPWRASRKRSGSATGQQAAERLFMTHGQAAQRPDSNRISECVSLRLLKEYQCARNRPKDIKGKTLPIPQSIVHTYQHIKQLLEDSRVIQDQTTLVLVTVNNTTVSSWLHERQKRTGRDSLLQGVSLPQTVSTAQDALPEARELPTAHVEHGHQAMEFQEPENRMAWSFCSTLISAGSTATASPTVLVHIWAAPSTAIPVTCLVHIWAAPSTAIPFTFLVHIWARPSTAIPVSRAFLIPWLDLSKSSTPPSA
ncbi:unnamed protein product [Pleuronectes platessa]|uniref:Uncharacterized protein n=1 Tax=Pleuronectes platessa TaxID=8262 RepID=A0A9N7VNC5_PLEPL|nr:unnamed protein product [Pleuronectes platessa]